jgi:hypothetical protein
VPELGHTPEVLQVVEIELIQPHSSILDINTFLSIYFTEPVDL